MEKALVDFTSAIKETPDAADVYGRANHIIIWINMTWQIRLPENHINRSW